MSQDRVSASRALCLGLVAAGFAALAGCAGPGAGLSRLDFDPLVGGRPLPEAAAKNAANRDGDNDPLLMPSGDGGSSPAALASAGAKERPREPKEQPIAGAKLGDPRAGEGKITQASAGVAKPAEDSYERLQQQLEARGVVWQLLKTGGERGEWHFACSIPDPNTAGVERHYEARASGAHGLAAIRAVLADIDADLKQRGER